MNWVDLVVVAAIVAGLASGYRRGALMQAFSWGGFVIGLFAGGSIAPRVVEAANPRSPLMRSGIAIGVFLGVAFLVETLTAILGHRIRTKITARLAHDIDMVAGSLIAGFLALVSAWFLGITFKAGPSPQLAAAIRGSAILRWTDHVAPHPPAFFAEIGRFLSRSGFPEVFAQLNPSLAPGVEPAPASLAGDPEIMAAAGLTYKIESRGCGGLVDGSGFPVGDRLVFTAAHVVAGTRDSRVIEPDGTRYPATVVYVDTSKDIALLRLARLPGGALRIDPDHAARGTDGAAIGYPGGGPRKISPARVRARTDALGRDIYSRKLVQREIYVLRAKVRQGNSGGPFVDAAGRVRGMVFAAAADNSSESYALAETELERAFSRARRRTQPVATGSCAV
ncbi:MAG: MarP family serine protease [Acidobacteria bacterium]|nr:MarP family serine protease [Acidobacteriota bacterium]